VSATLQQDIERATKTEKIRKMAITSGVIAALAAAAPIAAPIVAATTSGTMTLGAVSAGAGIITSEVTQAILENPEAANLVTVANTIEMATTTLIEPALTELTRRFRENLTDLRTKTEEEAIFEYLDKHINK
jgi:hypothetical protein